MNSQFVVLGSANGSKNLGDESMWESLVQILREIDPQSLIVTDGRSDWAPSFPNVRVLPFLAGEMRVDTFLNPLISKMLASSRIASLLSPFGKAKRADAIVKNRIVSGPKTALEKSWFDEIAKSNALIVAGAGAMNDNYPVHGVHSWRLLTHWAAMHNKKVLFLGQGVGPLEIPVNREAVRRLLNDVDLFTTRDELSSELVAKISNFEFRPDSQVDYAAIRATTEKELLVSQTELAKTTAADKFICLSLNLSSATFISRTVPTLMLGRRIAKKIIGDGYKILFVSNMTGSGFNDDRILGRVTKALLPKKLRNSFFIHEGQSDAGVVMAMISKSSGLISTRYHPVIFALKSGVPALGIYFDEYYKLKFSGAIAGPYSGQGIAISNRRLRGNLDISDALNQNIYQFSKVEASNLEKVRDQMKSRIAEALR